MNAAQAYGIKEVLVKLNEWTREFAWFDIEEMTVNVEYARFNVYPVKGEDHDGDAEVKWWEAKEID